MADIEAIRARAEAATEGPWEEVWRAIPGVDGYEVSDSGDVRSYYVKGNHKRRRAAYPRTLSTANSNGYRTVSLPIDGTYRTRRVHALVMIAFVGEPPEGCEIAHLNGDRADNRLANLAYVSHRENEAHKRKHGTNGAGERNSMATMQGWQVAEMRYLASKSVPQGKIAALFDVSHKYVSEVLSGRAWPDESARQDIPDLLAVIDKVRAIHLPMPIRSKLWCLECESHYPCPTVRALGGDS